MTDSVSPKCPRCSATLAASAAEGLCPRCLLAMSLGPETNFTDPASAVPKTAPLSPEELAPHFPQLEILELRGRGGMGVVYKARQKSLNRFVALKLLAPERVSDSKFAERFSREAQALAALDHPHIVTVYDFGVVHAVSPSPEGTAGSDPATAPIYFLLMEFVDGVNLRQAMKAGRFTPEQALAVVPPVCEALQFAHEHGIVHRDIKPENLLLDKSGAVKIADFGIAKMLGDDTGTGLAESQPAGTPQYMAPEQKDHQRTDHRADIYSLGVVLYELLTGELPADKLQPPSSRLRGLRIDVRLDEIVLRALEKTPELRYQTAAEMRTQVETMTDARPAANAGHPQGVAPSRFSRLAVLGALWMLVLPAALIFINILPLSTATLPSHDPGRYVLGIPAVALVVLGIFGLPGAPILGWVAVFGIRRSAGRLRGMWLAVFAALAYPLLALGKLTYWLLTEAAHLGVEFYANQSVQKRADVTSPLSTTIANALADHPRLAPSVAIFIWLVMAFFIVRRIWRAVNKPFLGPPDVFEGANRPSVPNTTLSSVAWGAAMVSGVFAGLSWCWMPQPPQFLIWSIPVAALAAIALAIPVRRSPWGHRAIWFGAVQIFVWSCVFLTMDMMLSGRAYEVLSTLNEKTQSLDEQVQVINEAIRLDPQSVDARRRLAQKLTEQKKYRSAAGEWGRVTTMDASPFGKQAVGMQGICHWLAGEPTQAVSCLEKAVLGDPTRVTERVFLAATYADLGLVDKVSAELVMLGRLKPRWQKEFEIQPDLGAERKAALAKITPFLVQSEATDPAKAPVTPVLGSSVAPSIVSQTENDKTVPWGGWNGGWSVRLRAGQTVWRTDELPQFVIDLRKAMNMEPDALLRTLHGWLFEVDGAQYRLSIFSTSWETKTVFLPGTTVPSFLTLQFHRDESDLHVRLLKEGVWINSYQLEGVAAEHRRAPFTWTPGKHTVRAAFPVALASPPDQREPLLAWSNPLDVEIKAGSDDDKTPPPALVQYVVAKEQIARIEALLKTTPVTTNYLAEIYEHNPAVAGEYRVRGDVKVIPVLPAEQSATGLVPLGNVYVTDKSGYSKVKTFYLQWDGAGANTLHFYGPFIGNPESLLGLTKLDLRSSAPSGGAAPKPLQNPARPEDAKKAWVEVTVGLSTAVFPPWGTREPTPRELAEHQKLVRERSLAIVGKARAFIDRFPANENIAAARLFVVQFSKFAMAAGDAQVEESLSSFVARVVSDPNIPEDDRAQVMQSAGEAAFMKKAGMKLFMPTQWNLDDDRLAATIESTRAALKQFPANAMLQAALVAAAQAAPAQRQKDLAAEVINAPGASTAAKVLAGHLLKGTKPYEIGQPVDIHFIALDGREVDLAKLKGKVVLVDFWSAAFTQSVGASPPAELLAAYLHLHDLGFEVVGISFDGDAAELRRYVREKELPWPQYFDGQGFQNKLALQYGIFKIPVRWLVDKRGNLRATDANYNLEPRIRELLKEQ